MDLAKQYSADDIQVLSREEWFKKMIFDKAPPEPVYVIIGFLQEPAGGHILDGSLVESYAKKRWRRQAFPMMFSWKRPNPACVSSQSRQRPSWQSIIRIMRTSFAGKSITGFPRRTSFLTRRMIT
jgi:hypothetical protein